MSDIKIAIILGSTRPGRKGKSVADQLESWTRAMRSVREGEAVHA